MNRVNSRKGHSLRRNKNNPTQKKPEEPNPYRSLGDALKHWERKLNVHDKKEKEEESPAADKESENDAEMKEKENRGEFEYTQDDDRRKEDNQVLGTASEEQLEAFDKEKIGQFPEEEEEKSTTQKEKEEKRNDDEKEEKIDESKQEGLSKKSRVVSSKDRQLPVDEEANESDDEQLKEITKEDKAVGEEDTEMDEFFPQLGPGKSNLVGITAIDTKNLGSEEMMQMRSDLARYMAEWQQDEVQVTTGMEIWRRLQLITGPLSQELCEQLRLLLEPTQTSKLRGDYRTGKRLNMRKVIPYIASNFRKDKIWLRRTKPAKREYQVLIGIDDSESVAIGGTGSLLREAVATVTQALVHLDVGRIGIIKFGADVELMHPFSDPFTDQSAARVFPRLRFEQQKTNMALFLETAVQMLELERSEANASDSNLLQLMFVMSDGRFGNERNHLRQWLRRAQEQNVFVVFLIVDTHQKKESILEIQQIHYVDGKMVVSPYIDGFPFFYYIILQKIASLPQVLADALRQWFEMINQKD